MCEVKKIDSKKETLFSQNIATAQIIPTNRPVQIDQDTPSDDVILGGPTFYPTFRGNIIVILNQSSKMLVNLFPIEKLLRPSISLESPQN